MGKETDFPLTEGTIISERLRQVFPKVLWLIPDGNRREAEAQGLGRIEGHKVGAENVLALARAAKDWGVEELTLWAFSRKNWQRPKKEVEFLINRLLPGVIEKYLEELDREGARLCIVGDRSRLPEKIIKKIGEAEEKTALNNRFRINILIDYDGTWHIAQAAERLQRQGVPVTGEFLFKELSKDLRPADCIIRTANESHLSGIESPLTQDAEFIVAKENFPVYNDVCLLRDLLEYPQRGKRGGR
jgi:undecaprenyl diphosphate synthase